jgi:cytochrome bd-type quinol oxidase subunit 2
MEKYPLIHGGLALEPNMAAAFLITLIHAIILIFDRKKKKTTQDLIMISIMFIPAIILLFYTIYN